MKIFLLLISSLLFIIAADAQINKPQTGGIRTDTLLGNSKTANTRPINVAGTFPTTAKLPEGTMFRSGTVEIQDGYTASYTDGNKVVVVKKDNGETTGKFACGCSLDASRQGSCTTHISGKIMTCDNDACNVCDFYITIDPKAGWIIAKEGTSKLPAAWKRLILPSKLALNMH